MISARPDAQRLPQHHAKRQRLHLGCGQDYRDGWLNVDANPVVDPDVVADVTDTPWSFADDAAATVIEAHQLVEHLADREAFFAEACRVLNHDGILRVSVPLGANARSDDDHKTEWTYRTPQQYSRAHRRPWDPDLPLELVNRSLDVWLAGPLSPGTPLLRAASRIWPAWAAERCYAGVLTATYRRLRGER